MNQIHLINISNSSILEVMKFPYVFAENGLVAYNDTKLLGKQVGWFDFFSIAINYNLILEIKFLRYT